MIDLENIRVLMIRKRLNQSKLAERSGLANSTVSKFLAGKEMKFSTVAAIARALELSEKEISELLFCREDEIFPARKSC